MLSTGVRATMLAFCVLLVLQVYWPMASAAPGPQELANMAEALKYLQELDNYYSKVARPSHQLSARSSSGLDRTRKDPDLEKHGNAIKLLHLLHLDRRYSRLARPRFGRSLPVRTPEQDAAADADDRKTLLFRRR